MFSDLVQPYVNYVPPLLEAGVRVLIYAGDADYICNWIGNKAWITALEWSGTPAFLQIFLKDYPKYSKSNFTVTGESYAGHYIPAIAHAIQESNLIVSQSNPKNLKTVNLESIAIGNGLTDPLVQYEYYPDMACDKKYGPVLEEAECEAMRSKYDTCKSLINACYRWRTPFSCV